MLYLDCICTKRILVTPSLCGGDVRCDCGKTVSVPKLSELRRLNGVSHENLSPLQRLQKLDDHGELLTDFTCAVCRTRRGDLHDCWVQCEALVAKGPGLLGTIAYICMLPFFTLGSGVALLLSRNSEYDNPEIHGRDTAVIVAVPVCAECERGFRKSDRRRRAALRAIGAYSDLLNAYPDATTHYCSQDGG